MRICVFFVFFDRSSTTQINTLSLHDALPISVRLQPVEVEVVQVLRELHLRFERSPAFPLLVRRGQLVAHERFVDRKSTRLNSSHSQISYAVFCLKKKKLLEDEAIRSVDLAHY